MLCASIVIGVQLLMMYYNIRIPDAMFYSITMFLVVLNLITLYILMRKRNESKSIEDLSGIKVMIH